MISLEVKDQKNIVTLELLITNLYEPLLKQWSVSERLLMEEVPHHLGYKTL